MEHVDAFDGRIRRYLSHYNPGTCYGNQITVFLVLREDLSILPQKDTVLRMNDIMVIREENKK